MKKNEKQSVLTSRLRTAAVIRIILVLQGLISILNRKPCRALRLSSRVVYNSEVLLKIVLVSTKIVIYPNFLLTFARCFNIVFRSFRNAVQVEDVFIKPSERLRPSSITKIHKWLLRYRQKSVIRCEIGDFCRIVY